jgi:peroxiredoxin
MKSSLRWMLVPICAGAFAAAPPGTPAPSFTLTDLEGRPAKLEDYRGRVVVLEWNNFGCPFVQKHYRSGNMQALQKKYGADVVWLTLNSTSTTSSDHETNATLQSKLAGFGAQPAHYLVDEPGKVGQAYGAKTTPHMYVIDTAGKVVYNGAIDDRRSTEPADVKGAKNYVVAALEDVKAGRPVATPSTTPYGCSIKYR